jgi:hypothetical protein
MEQELMQAMRAVDDDDDRMVSAIKIRPFY